MFYVWSKLGISPMTPFHRCRVYPLNLSSYLDSGDQSLTTVLSLNRYLVRVMTITNQSLCSCYYCCSIEWILHLDHNTRLKTKNFTRNFLFFTLYLSKVGNGGLELEGCHTILPLIFQIRLSGQPTPGCQWNV